MRLSESRIGTVVGVGCGIAYDPRLLVSPQVVETGAVDQRVILKQGTMEGTASIVLVAQVFTEGACIQETVVAEGIVPAGVGCEPSFNVISVPGNGVPA